MKEKQKKTNKKLIICICAVVLVAVIAVCIIVLQKQPDSVPENPPYTNIVNSPQPAVSGGSEQKDVNINSITLENLDNAVNVNFQFVSGSAMDENVVSCGVPKYNVEIMPAPLRLKVTFSSVTYWDYMVSGMAEDTSGIIDGMFQISPNENNKDVTLYFSLRKNVQFKVNENGDKLTINLNADTTQDESSKWYLVSDLYYEYQLGSMPECGFTPMLCNDLISVIMISDAYNTKEDAENAMLNLVSTTLKDINVRVVELKETDLPAYNDEADAEALLSESVLSINGAKTTLPLFYADARFLCWIPDGSGALFAKNENGMERLYVADKNGTKHQLSDKDFATITEAVYSKDGTKIAFTEQAEETTLVTVLDVKTGDITVINDENNPWGEIIMGVQLNNDGSKLFCLSGKTTYSIKTYDFTTNTATTIKDNILLESDLIFNTDYLYYCDVVNEYEAVVRINVNGGDAELIHKGAQFTLSPDGKRLAVISENYVTAVCDLCIVDIETKDSKIVLDDIVTSEFFFTSDSESIFYVLETGDPEYYYQIIRYDIATASTYTLAQCINSVVSPSDKPNEVIISVIKESENGVTPVTYIADFDKMVVGEPEEPQE